MSRNRSLVRAVAALCLCVCLGYGMGAAQSSFDKLLTMSDVEKVTGLKGCKVLPQDFSKAVVGDLNVFRQDGERLLEVSFWDLKTYELAKLGHPYAVEGLADEAFEGPTGSIEHGELIFRKGDRAAMVISELDPGTAKPFLSGKPLRELARIIASRM